LQWKDWDSIKSSTGASLIPLRLRGWTRQSAILTFGCAFVDIDNDGWLDIFAANGPIPDFKTESLRGEMARAQRPLVFHNLGEGRFKEVGLASGKVLQQALVARGLAHADIDLDGDADLVMTTNNGQACCYVTIHLSTNQPEASATTLYASHSKEHEATAVASMQLLKLRWEQKDCTGVYVVAPLICRKVNWLLTWAWVH
jgi:hypothetical protein